MNKYLITTDSASDLPKSYLQEHNVYSQSLFYNLGDELYGGEKQLDYKTFYNRMRSGEMPVTNAIIPEELINGLRPYLQDGYDILHIAFSSALSSTYQNAVIAADELKEEFPERTITVVDSKSASLGQGLLVYKAIQKQKEGLSLAENAAWIEENLSHICHEFTVDDLFHLHRGGRVSKGVAIIGSLINIKPMLFVNDEGELKMKGTSRGRKKSLMTLVKAMEESTKDCLDKNDIVFISHGDCLEDAQFVANQIETRLGIKTFLIDYVSPTIGAHAGPGVVALFFWGSHR